MSSMNMEMSLISSSNSNHATSMNVQTPANRSTAVCFLRRSEGEIAFSYYATDAGGPAWYVKLFTTPLNAPFI